MSSHELYGFFSIRVADSYQMKAISSQQLAVSSLFKQLDEKKSPFVAQAEESSENKSEFGGARRLVRSALAA
jgi:hypothetical protein